MTPKSDRYVARELRLYPSVEQADYLLRCRESFRWLWNLLVDIDRMQDDRGDGRRYADRAGHEKPQTQKQRIEFVRDWNRANGLTWPAQSVQGVAKDVDFAWKLYHEGRKRGDVWHKPKWKGIHQPPKIHLTNQQVEFKRRRVRISKVGWMDWRGGTLPDGKLYNATLWLDAGNRWMLSVTFVCGPLPCEPSVIPSVGLDLGLKSFVVAVDSNDDTVVVQSLKALRNGERRLKLLQRRLSRRKKGSKQRKRAREQVANQYRRIRNRRKAFHHELSTWLVSRYGKLTVESLNIKGMLKNHHLAKSLSDAAFGEFLRQVKYKAEWRGRELVEANQWFASSQLCSECGEQDTSMKDLSKREFHCGFCGYVEDRDVNAARNLRRYGDAHQNLPAA